MKPNVKYFKEKLFVLSQKTQSTVLDTGASGLKVKVHAVAMGACSEATHFMVDRNREQLYQEVAQATAIAPLPPSRPLQFYHFPIVHSSLSPLVG